MVYPLDYLSAQIEDRRTSIEQHLGRGGAATFDEYQKLCGVIQGLDTAKQIITDLAQRMETGEDE